MLLHDRVIVSDHAKPAASPLKVWLNGAHLIGIACLLAILVMALGLAFIDLERNDKRSENLLQLQQLAKLMARQSASDISAVESMLLVLASADRDLRDPREPGQIEPLIGSVVRGYPQLRSVSVLNEEGRVLASSSPGNVGVQVQLAMFGAATLDASKVTIGQMLEGRDLADTARRATGASRLTVLPMLVRLSNPTGQGQTLVALINADYFGSVYEASANDPTVRVALVGYNGELLVATRNVVSAIGSSLRQLRLFTEFLPSREWGSYVGAGMDDPNVLTAFSMLPQWPMALIVESSLSDVMRELMRVERWTMSVALAALLVISALTLLTTRSLKRHQSINEELHQTVYASEARQRAMFESSIDGILTVDSGGCIVAVNPAAQSMFGRASAEVTGRLLHEFMVPSHLRQSHQEGLERYLKTSDGPVLARLNRRIETVGMRADESVFPIELTIVPLQVHGQVFFTVSVRDISEKKDNEREKADLLLKYKELATDLERQKMAIAQASQRELEIGTRIQQSLLTASPLRQLSDLWMSSFNQASRGIDGDFVEVIQVGEDCVDIIAGDVMGKGVPAALMGAATKLQFSRALAELLAAQESGQEAPQPISIVSLVHQAMTPHLQALEAFVTLSYLRIDRARTVITWVGCGHEESILIHADGHIMLLPNQHPPLGVLGRVDLIQDQVPLVAGDALFLCSDGLADAVVPSGERIGRELINQTVRKLVREHATPGAVLHCLRRELLPSDVIINDDVSLVLVMQSPEKDARSRCELLVDIKSLRAYRDFVRQQAIRAGMVEAEAAIFEVASVEVFTNIIRHARGLLAGAPVELVAYSLSQNFVLEVIHLGDAFAPPEELVETNFDVFPEGGFGLMIIRNACDHVEYLHHQGVNTVRMSRYIET